LIPLCYRNYFNILYFYLYDMFFILKLYSDVLTWLSVLGQLY